MRKMIILRHVRGELAALAWPIRIGSFAGNRSAGPVE